MIWKAVHWSIHLISWIAMALVFVGLVKKNKNPAKVTRDGQIVFAPTWLEAGAWMFLSIRMCFIASDFLRNGVRKPLDFVTGMMMGFVALGMIFSLPGPVVVTDEGLKQVYWLRQNKRIRWTDIVEINTEKKGLSITVIGSNGAKIVHSGLLADRERFLMELKQHCGDELPSDFPRETVTDA